MYALIQSKDPNDVKDYGSAFTLNSGDTITGATVLEVTAAGVLVTSGSTLIISGKTFAAPNARGESIVTVVLSGGTAGVTYFLWFSITTATGRIFNRTIQLACEVRG
jgi:hypothetical protein